MEHSAADVGFNSHLLRNRRETAMNTIIYVVGLVVVVAFILSFLGIA